MNEIKYINSYFIRNNSYSEHIYDLTQTRQLCLVVKNPPANAGDLRDEGLQIWKRHVHPNVHRSTVYHSQDMEAT